MQRFSNGERGENMKQAKPKYKLSNDFIFKKSDQKIKGGNRI